MKKSNTTTKIILAGTAGDGIRFISRKLIEMLTSLKNIPFITYYFDYDSTVRGGRTVSYITCNHTQPVQTFIFRTCDILLSLRENNFQDFKAAEVITKSNTIDFQTLALKHFKRKLQANMIALGYLIAKLDIKIDVVKLKDTNKKAFYLGYKLYA